MPKLGASPAERPIIAGMAFRPSVHLPLIFVAFGGIFAAAGLWFLVDTSAEGQLARGAALATVNGATISGRQAGEVVLLQGRLAASNPAVFRDFAAAHRERFDGMSTGSGTTAQRERWSTMEIVAPPITVDADGGSVAIVNSGYQLRAPLHYWRDAPTLIEKDLLTAYERASGFAAGDLVTVEGQVVDVVTSAGGTRRALAATAVFGGDHGAYLATLNDGLLVTKILGSVFTGLGTLVMAIAGLVSWRASRIPVAPAGTGSRDDRTEMFDGFDDDASSPSEE